MDVLGLALSSKISPRSADSFLLYCVRLHIRPLPHHPIGDMKVHPVVDVDGDSDGDGDGDGEEGYGDHNDDDNDNRDKGFLWMGLRRMMVMMRRGSLDDMVVMRQEVPSCGW